MLKCPTAVGSLLLTSVLLCGCSFQSEEASDVSSDRQAILSDGIVTAAEYKAAVDAHVSCLEQKGYNATAVQGPDKIMWVLGFDGDASDDMEGGEKAYDKCYDDYVAGVDKEYFIAHIPTGADRDALYAEFAECLDGFGVPDANPSWTEAEVVNAIAERTGPEMSALTCIGQYQVLYPEGMFEDR